MKIIILKETEENEKRVALVPDHLQLLKEKGNEVILEAGAGKKSGFHDKDYEKAGGIISTDRKEMMALGEIILCVQHPSAKEIEKIKPNSWYIGTLDPFNNPLLVQNMAEKNVSCCCMEMIPRTTRAQKMDVLSSQASLAGYVAVILAATHSRKVFPMMMTPAGTIVPSRVFVIGAGVAGLQAIATAKRLGARVESFDTRPVVKEQVESLGARFISIDIGETGQTKDGYAKALTPEQLELQRRGIEKVCSYSDIVITTAQVFGRKAPRIITDAMVSRMKTGSVLVDMAVASGGNIEGSIKDSCIDIHGVTVIGYQNLPSFVAMDASLMYSSNIYHFIEECWDDEKKTITADITNEILQGCLLTHQGKILNKMIEKKILSNQQ